MAHYIAYAVFYEGSVIGKRQNTLPQAEQERKRLIEEEGYPLGKLVIMKVVN